MVNMILLYCKYYCVLGSTIYSDLWKAYETIEEIPGMNFRHLTVNHSENFVDPVTGAHTQSIESLWGKVKYRKKKECGVPRAGFDSFLCEFLWRQNNKNKDLFRKILSDIVEYWPPTKTLNK